MNFEAVMISSEPPLLVRIVYEVSDRVGNAIERVRYLPAAPRLSRLRTRSTDDNPDGLFSSLPSDSSLIRRIRREVSDIFSAGHAEPASVQAEVVRRLAFLVAATEEALPMRLFKAAKFAFTQIDERSEFQRDAATGEQAYADLAFLRETAALLFPMRLAREAAEAARTFASDPMGFIKALPEGDAVLKKEQRRVGAGLSVATMVYVVAFSVIYGSYYISHRNRSSVESRKQIEVTLLALPPVIAVKPPPPIKQAGGGSNQMNLPKQAAEQPRLEVVKPRPELRPLDQIQPRPDVQAEPARATTADAAGPSSMTTAGLSGGTGTGGGAGTGHGTGVGSGNGSGVGTGESVDYNGVFSVGSVTVRPQILGRPTPGYTDEARRNQIEGSVKVSVLLKADGIVSEVRVTRGLGYGLDEKAIEAARQLRFVPGQKDGHAVSVRLFVEFKFSLL
ncbi:MAG TPA: TonB family protein [Blastocatellia bacterium]|nr:TonB family protein [Blastocatellia bacterium]